VATVVDLHGVKIAKKTSVSINIEQEHEGYQMYTAKTV
jgi:hypothetical protein